MAQMSSSIPARKVVSGSVGGAAATVILYLLETYIVEDPIPMAVTAAITTLVVFVFGYIVPPSENDTITSPSPA